MNPSKSVAFPILKYASEYMTDDYWKTLFEILSVGKCPAKCIYISGSNILSTNKKKQFSFTIPSYPEPIPKAKVIEFSDEFKKFLVVNTNLFSKDDNDKRKENLNKTYDLKHIEKWSDISKKNIKTQLKLNYIIECKDKYKLKNSSTKDLYILINTAFDNLKTHTSADIKIKSGKITEIKDIVYDNKIKKFINLRDNNSEDEDVEEDDQLFLFYQWDRYCSSHIKSS